MRQVTKAEFIAYIDADDLVIESIKQIGNYVIGRRFSVGEWVYVELP